MKKVYMGNCKHCQSSMIVITDFDTFGDPLYMECYCIIEEIKNDDVHPDIELKEKSL